MNETVNGKLQGTSIRPTSLHVLILRFLLEEKECISGEALGHRFYNADKSMLHSTLSTLLEKGLIKKIEDKEGGCKYELARDDSHKTTEFATYNFHCISCLTNYSLNFSPIARADLPKGFMLVSSEPVIKGKCSLCLTRK